MPTPATYRLLLGEVVAQNYDLPVVAARVVKILLVEKSKSGGMVGVTGLEPVTFRV